MEFWQIRLSTDGRFPLFSDETARREALAVLVRHAGPWLLSFGLADDHMHTPLRCSRQRAGKVARALVVGLKPVTGQGFQPAYISAIKNRGHLVNAVEYGIIQPLKHGLAEHPALWSGSAFSDIVGARTLDGLQMRTAEVLPRYRRADAWKKAGLPLEGIPPLDIEGVRRIGLTALRRAAAFSAGAPPDLLIRSRAVVRARAAFVDLGRDAGFRVKDLASELSVGPEAIRRLGKRPVDQRLYQAVMLRAAIEDALRPSDTHASG